MLLVYVIYSYLTKAYIRIILFSCNMTPQAVTLKSVVYNKTDIMVWYLQSFRDQNLAVDFPKNIKTLNEFIRCLYSPIMDFRKRESRHSGSYVEEQNCVGKF